MHGSTLGRGWQVSLGDSYSAGVGSSQPFEDLACFRTGGAWPRLLPNFMIWLHACSGAQVDDLGNQIQQMNADFGRTRLPQLITVTIGGNDAGFSRGLAECVLHACRPDGARIGHQIDALEPKLVALYRRIRAAQPFADIVVGGYPGVVQVGGDSTNLACVAVDDDERLMIDALAARLNSRIADAARRAGVWTVGQSVRRRFAGHNACAGRASWIRSPALGYGGGGIPVDVRSFHPTDAGQRAYAQVFSSVVRARSR
jgi:lysophospholipase L1-like esterase